MAASRTVRNGFTALYGLLDLFVRGVTKILVPVGIGLWIIADILGYHPDIAIVVWLLVIEIARLRLKIET